MQIKNKLPLLAISIGFFIVILDVTIVNVALPQLERKLHSSVSQLQWVVDGYTLTFACFLLTAGYLADIFGAKKMYIGGVAGFVITSLACGLAPNIETLIAVRLLQGLSASLMIPASLTLINNSYTDDKQKAKAIAAWASSGAIAAASGPVLGGILASYYSWRSVFLVNLPIGIIAIYLSYKYTVDIIVKMQKVHFDILGQILIIISIAALSFALIEASELDWGAIPIIGAFIIFIISLALFLIVEIKHPYPVVDISLFKNTHFGISAILGVLLNFGYYGFLFVMPLYLSSVKHFTTLQIGFALCPLMLLMLLGNILSGRMCANMGAKYPILYGFILGTIGFFSLLIMIYNDLSYSIMILPELLLGMSAALTMPALTMVIIGATPKNKVGFASATFNTSRQLGSLLGVAILGTVVDMIREDLATGTSITLIITTICYLVSTILTIFFISKT